MASLKPANYYIPKPIPSGGNRFVLPIIQPMPGRAPVRFTLPILPPTQFTPVKRK